MHCFYLTYVFTLDNITAEDDIDSLQSLESFSNNINIFDTFDTSIDNDIEGASCPRLTPIELNKTNANERTTEGPIRTKKNNVNESSEYRDSQHSNNKAEIMDEANNADKISRTGVDLLANLATIGCSPRGKNSVSNSHKQ